jgi:hypothetical protein
MVKDCEPNLMRADALGYDGPAPHRTHPKCTADRSCQAFAVLLKIARKPALIEWRPVYSISRL